MPNIPLYMAGDTGIIKDIATHELPPTAWSGGTNIAFLDGKVVRRNGQEQRFPGHLGQPYFISLAYTLTNAYWVYADKTKMYATDGGAHAEITRASGVYGSLELDRLWDGGMFQGIPVFTNGKDKPQAWTNIALANKLIDLPNWPPTYLCKLIHPFKNFLVAMNISYGGNTYPNMVLWSDAADPGSLPTTWDVSDPTQLAGTRDLVDEFPGGIINAMNLRDILIIYKDNSVWGMQFIGGTQIMRTYQILSGIGTLGPHSVALIDKGSKHAFATEEDLIIFDGQNSVSALENKWKKYLRDNLDPTTGKRSFVFAREKTNEVMLCFPELGHEFPNAALVWNWRDGTVAYRNFDADISLVALGPISISGDPWNLDTATWDSDATIWDLVSFRAGNFDVLAAKPGADLGTSRLLEMGVGQQYEGVDYLAYVERLDLAVVGQDKASGAIKSDFEMRKLTTRIWPHVEGAPVWVSMGARETIDGAYTWLPTQKFTPGVDKYLDFIIGGRFMAVKFESNVEGVWKLEGYNLELEPLGNL